MTSRSHEDDGTKADGRAVYLSRQTARRLRLNLGIELHILLDISAHESCNLLVTDAPGRVKIEVRVLKNHIHPARQI
jgi:hypothetical protein